MVTIDTISAALTSFDTLKNIAQAMLSLRDAQTIQAKVLEFQGQLIDAQSKVFAVNHERSSLIERVRELEEEVADLKRWEAEKQRYELKAIAGGSFAYVLKPEAQGAEPPHEICATCYQRGQKSILQREPRSGVSSHLGMPKMLFCPECNTKIVDDRTTGSGLLNET